MRKGNSCGRYCPISIKHPVERAPSASIPLSRTHTSALPLPPAPAPACNFNWMAASAWGRTRAAEKVTARLSSTRAACFLRVHLAETTSSYSSLSWDSFLPLRKFVHKINEHSLYKKDNGRKLRTESKVPSMDGFEIYFFCTTGVRFFF